MNTLTAKYPGGTYPLYIGEGLIQSPKLLRKHVRSKQMLIVTNNRVAELYLKTIKAAFTSDQCNIILLPDGEAYKTLEELNKIWDTLAENKHHRDTTLISLGGGVIGDITGFAAACYHRGVNFIQIPTTLLSQVDASIGGKTAIDHPCGKNLIGAFHQPVAVIIDVDTLSTLPDREYRAGITEIIKAALIKDKSFFKWLETNLKKLLAKDKQTLMKAIPWACKIKCDVVETDEKEHGERALLNLGHTFGHAIEQNLGYRNWTHGEAVALGILIAADLSAKKNGLTTKEHAQIRNMLTQLNMPDRLPPEIKHDTLRATLWSDKKVRNNQLRLVLLKGIGQAVVTTDVTNKELDEVLAKYFRS